MLKAGFETILQRISERSEDSKLIDKFLVLVSEKEDSREKCELLLSLINKIKDTEYFTAMQVAKEVFNYASSSPDLFHYLRESLLLIAGIFESIGRFGKAEVIRMTLTKYQEERDRLGQITPKGQEKKKNLPPKAAFSTTVKSPPIPNPEKNEEPQDEPKPFKPLPIQ
ncbi:MAG: hypothetical protein HQK54_07180, partial [Oligoflexales bacterium]|nr:hypothetical protein [Oligoflexales bacterium]